MMFFFVSILKIVLTCLPGDCLLRWCSGIPSFRRTSRPIRLFVLCTTTSIWQFWAVQDPDCRVSWSMHSTLMLLLLKHLYCVWLFSGCSLSFGLFFMNFFAFSRLRKVLGDPVSANQWFVCLFDVVVSTQISSGLFVGLFVWCFCFYPVFFGCVWFSVVFFIGLMAPGVMWFTSAQCFVSSRIYNGDLGSTYSVSTWSSVLFLSGFLEFVWPGVDFGFVPGDVDILLFVGSFVVALGVFWATQISKVACLFADSALCLIGWALCDMTRDEGSSTSPTQFFVCVCLLCWLLLSWIDAGGVVWNCA